MAPAHGIGVPRCEGRQAFTSKKGAMVGALSLLPILKISPYPTPGTPRIKRGAVSFRPALTVLSQHHAS
jgi:hypothetical protein